MFGFHWFLRKSGRKKNGPNEPYLSIVYEDPYRIIQWDSENEITRNLRKCKLMTENESKQ